MTVVVVVTVLIASALMLLAIREADMEDRFNRVSRNGVHSSPVRWRRRGH